MGKLLKSFKTEINPTVEQKIKISKTIGVCRYVYNFYIDHNKALYDNGAIKKDLKLSDRIYRCDCGYVEDRDLNAALNLRDALTYEVA